MVIEGKTCLIAYLKGIINLKKPNKQKEKLVQ
jgi:hypothetical protein